VKFLIWAVLGYFIVSWILRSGKISKTSHDNKQNSNHVESILQCAHCGVHVPASEAVITQSGGIFCSEEHRAQMKKPSS
jgi:uncharacterized protein